MYAYLCICLWMMNRRGAQPGCQPSSSKKIPLYYLVLLLWPHRFCQPSNVPLLSAYTWSLSECDITINSLRSFRITWPRLWFAPLLKEAANTIKDKRGGISPNCTARSIKCIKIWLQLVIPCRRGFRDERRDTAEGRQWRTYKTHKKQFS